MKQLSYKNKANVVIGSHTQDERKYQVCNHYNMVESYLNQMRIALWELQKKYSISYNDKDKIDRLLGNAIAQHLNEGYNLSGIKELNINEQHI